MSSNSQINNDKIDNRSSPYSAFYGSFDESSKNKQEFPGNTSMDNNQNYPSSNGYSSHVSKSPINTPINSPNNPTNLTDNTATNLPAGEPYPRAISYTNIPNTNSSFVGSDTGTPPIVIVAAQQSLQVKPFSSIFPSVPGVGATNRPHETDRNVDKSIYDINLKTNQSMEEIIKRRNLIYEFRRLIRYNNEILPVEFRTKYVVNNTIYQFGSFGIFFYFFFKVSELTKNNSPVKKTVFLFIATYMSMSILSGSLENHLTYRAFNSMYQNNSNDSIEKSLMEFSQTIPLLKI